MSNKCLTFCFLFDMLFKQSTRKQVLVVLQYADVAELADALDLGSSVYDVQVQPIQKVRIHAV